MNRIGASQLALVVKNLPANKGDARMAGSIPGLGQFPRVENGNPLQYFCLENSLNRGAWKAIYSPWGRKESDTTEHTNRISALITEAPESCHTLSAEDRRNQETSPYQSLNPPMS